MQFISPSFPGNNFGFTDLNAISYDSSPAFSLRREHPSGQEYAHYLQQAATAFALEVEKGYQQKRADERRHSQDRNVHVHSKTYDVGENAVGPRHRQRVARLQIIGCHKVL